MALFNRGCFKLHSGELTEFKIDCDALSAEDLAALAVEISRRTGRYKAVEGVPTGGNRIADALRAGATGKEEDVLLIVDDVYTTGASMEEKRNGWEARGFVLFARRPITQSWIKALFTMDDVDE